MMWPGEERMEKKGAAGGDQAACVGHHHQPSCSPPARGGASSLPGSFLARAPASAPRPGSSSAGSGLREVR